MSEDYEANRAVFIALSEMLTDQQLVDALVVNEFDLPTLHFIAKGIECARQRESIDAYPTLDRLSTAVQKRISIINQTIRN
jgi:hypothetical protein